MRALLVGLFAASAGAAGFIVQAYRRVPLPPARLAFPAPVLVEHTSPPSVTPAAPAVAPRIVSCSDTH